MNAGTKRFFADTNLLLYAVDNSDPNKQARAGLWLQHLWMQGSGRLSWQVLHEFYWNAIRKFRLSPTPVRAITAELTKWDPVDTSLGLIERAWHWVDSSQLVYWDALILAAAERCEADYLLSEDFQADRKYGNCRVLNPFTADPNDYFPA